MKKVVFSVILLLSIMFSACGKNTAETNGKPKTPVLNENGKEEITLCITAVSTYIENAVAEYNAQSDRYEIVINTTPEGMSPLDYRKRVQLDLSNGKGSDIFHSSAFNDFDMTPYAEDGYLMDVTDFIEEKWNFVDIIATYDTIDGKTYGIPTAFSMLSIAVPNSLDISREENTKEYCMELVQETNKSLGLIGYDILEFFGIGVNEIQLYDDEEKGISLFDTQEFIDLLEFAKQYAYVANGMTIHEKVLSKEQLFLTVHISEFMDFWFFEVLFDEIPSYIGYPSVEGGKEHIFVENFYINSKSEHKEGALDFMRYLLSEEQQREMFDHGFGFPARKTLLEKIWDEAKEEPYVGTTKFSEGLRSGLTFYPRIMTEKEEEAFWAMLEEKPVNGCRVSAISDIVYEETAPFFEGKKTAEEVAKIIDNRVQLYLDERK